jgi:RimJ/RimL family protein N-acetyltransferase
MVRHLPFCFASSGSAMNLVLETTRLRLRPPETADISAFVPLIGNFRVARNLSRVPHPYTEADGRKWLAEIAAKRADGADFPFALIRKSDGAFLGICSVHPSEDFTVGYWLGEPFWGMGYATEAAHRVARFAFEELGATKLIAGYMTDNPVSGRVLEKLGFAHTHDAPYHCVSRREDVPAHRVALTPGRFENVTLRP